MPDIQIQKDFLDGIEEIYKTLFTNGVDDGIYLYNYHESPANIYGEIKFKKYKEPVLLSAKVQLTPTQSDNMIEELKDVAKFSVPRKVLTDKEIDVSSEGISYLRKGYIKYKNIFYEIINVKPTVFIEDVFLVYLFECVEDIHVTSLSVVSEGGA